MPEDRPAGHQQAGQWSDGAAEYEAAVAPLTRPFAHNTLDLLGVGDVPGLRLLDVAAGTGVVSVEAARRGARVLATDFAPGMVEIVRRRFESEGLPGEAEVMDGQNLELEAASFDLAASNFGLMFFPDAAQGLREHARVVRPGGHIAIASWDLVHVGLQHLVRMALARTLPGESEPPPPAWAPFGTTEGLAAAVGGAGFEEVAVHPVINYWHITDPAALFVRLPASTPALRELFASLPTDAMARATEAFEDVVIEHTTDDGLAANALIGVAARP
jgi:SAM-dependent methyltransferase